MSFGDIEPTLALCPILPTQEGSFGHAFTVVWADNLTGIDSPQSALGD
jgi:hypothetical protein